MTDNDRRKQLVRIAANLDAALSDVDRGYVYLSQEDAETLANGLNAYLSGGSESLDAAFGTKRGRGAPKKGPSRKALENTEKVMFRGTKTWLDVESEIGLNQRTLQRLVDRHGSHVIEVKARELVERMEEKDRLKKGP